MKIVIKLSNRELILKAVSPSTTILELKNIIYKESNIHDYDQTLFFNGVILQNAQLLKDINFRAQDYMVLYQHKKLTIDGTLHQQYKTKDNKLNTSIESNYSINSSLSQKKQGNDDQEDGLALLDSFLKKKHIEKKSENASIQNEIKKILTESNINSVRNNDNDKNQQNNKPILTFQISQWDFRYVKYSKLAKKFLNTHSAAEIIIKPSSKRSITNAIMIAGYLKLRLGLNQIFNTQIVEAINSSPINTGEADDHLHNHPLTFDFVIKMTTCSQNCKPLANQMKNFEIFKFYEEEYNLTTNASSKKIQEICYICSSHFRPDDKKTQLDCSHVFHQNCFLLNNSPNCVFCGQKIGYIVNRSVENMSKEVSDFLLKAEMGQSTDTPKFKEAKFVFTGKVTHNDILKKIASFDGAQSLNTSKTDSKIKDTTLNTSIDQFDMDIMNFSSRATDEDDEEDMNEPFFLKKLHKKTDFLGSTSLEKTHAPNIQTSSRSMEPIQKIEQKPLSTSKTGKYDTIESVIDNLENYKKLDQLNRKDILRNILYPIVRNQVGDDLAPRITKILTGLDEIEILYIFMDDNASQQKIYDILELITQKH